MNLLRNSGTMKASVFQMFRIDVFLFKYTSNLIFHDAIVVMVGLNILKPKYISCYTMKLKFQGFVFFLRGATQ